MRNLHERILEPETLLFSLAIQRKRWLENVLIFGLMFSVFCSVSMSSLAMMDGDDASSSGGDASQIGAKRNAWIDQQKVAVEGEGDRALVSFEELQNGLQSIYERTSGLRSSERRVVILGPSGSGKSTLLHYLAEKQLVASRTPNGRILTVADPLPGMVIGHGLMSATTLPFSWNAGSGEVYWDCPGFGDTRGPGQAILNAFAIDQLFQSTQVKIALTVPEELLTGRMSEFLSLLRQTTEMIPPDDLQQGMCLVITRRGRTADLDPTQILHSVLDPSQDTARLFDLTPAVRDVLRYLVDNHETLITGFSYPTHDGIYEPHERKTILECIRAANFLPSPKATPHIPPASRVLVEDLTTVLNRRGLQIIRKDLSDQVTDQCCALLETFPDLVESRDGLVRALTILIDDLRQIQETQSSDAVVFASALGRFLEPRPNPIEGLVQKFTFLARVKPDVTCSVADWALGLQKVIQQIRGWSVSPLDLYTLAAERGNPEAQVRLGSFLERGHGTPKNSAEAFRWYTLAAAQKHSGAQWRLGVMLYEGTDVTKDASSAKHWLESAAILGHAEARALLRGPYFTYIYPAEQGDVAAQGRLGKLYLSGTEPSISKDVTQAIAWFSKAADHGDAQAQFGFGEMHQKGDELPRDLEGAARWFLKAADQDHTEAQARLGLMHLGGFGVPKSDEQAAAYFIRAAGKGHGISQLNLGILLYRGYQGGHQDLPSALECFKKEGAQGLLWMRRPF